MIRIAPAEKEHLLLMSELGFAGDRNRVFFEFSMINYADKYVWWLITAYIIFGKRVLY